MQLGFNFVNLGSIEEKFMTSEVILLIYYTYNRICLKKKQLLDSMETYINNIKATGNSAQLEILNDKFTIIQQRSMVCSRNNNNVNYIIFLTYNKCLKRKKKSRKTSAQVV